MMKDLRLPLAFCFVSALLLFIFGLRVVVYADEIPVEPPAVEDTENSPVDDESSVEPPAEEVEESGVPDPEPPPGGDSPEVEEGDTGTSDDVDDIPVDYSSEPLDIVLLSDIYSLMSESQLFSVEDNQYPESAPFAAGYYIECSTSQLGTVMMYVPYNFQRGSFSFDDTGNLVNITSSTITGIVFRGNTSYTLRFSSFGNPQYRSSSGSSSYMDLTVNEVLNTNVQIFSSQHQIALYPDSQLLQLILVFLGGVIVCKLFLTH